MSDEQNAKSVNIDPRSIQDGLRMYLHPIKNEDPQLDFYTMYKREAMEYDTEHMQKYNEDLNTTLIFAGLFSAVSSAFVIDVQSKLEPDPTERSEAYLRAILLSLNGSITPDEDPTAPSPWNGPSTEIITTSDLLYASLLMSLLAAFVAMLGKQWLNRYLRHTGGSMVERCGDRQRKCNGLEKWPFHVFIESLPIMLQIALLLLACGLSRYMWSINTSVARVVISFTVIGILFYVGIVVAGTSSYECPFQTPGSATLRALRHSRTPQKLLASFSPLKIVLFLHITCIGTRKLFSFGVHRVQNAVVNRSSWNVLLSSILSDVHQMGRNFGHHAIILLLHIGRTVGNAKQRIIQSIRRSRRAVLLPITGNNTQGQPGTSQEGLRVPVRNLETLRRLNADNAWCVCWILQNITDPEAVDSAIRLAGTIRWFDRDIDVDLPFDVIVSTFEACFNSNKELYPGMRDRAYLSGRAILQINTCARLQSHECASKYPIPSVSSYQVYLTDGDLGCVASMLKDVGPSTRHPGYASGSLCDADSLWMSGLFVDLARASSPTISHLLCAARPTHHQAVNVNLLLAWHVFLGGNVEEETFWAVDKSDYLEETLSHLSTRVVNLIPDSTHLQYLVQLLDFLAAWENLPLRSTLIGYRLCSPISRKLQELDQGRTALENQLSLHPPGSYHSQDSQDETADNYAALLLTALRVGFRQSEPIYRLYKQTSYHHWMFDIVFLSDDDEVIADVVCAWAMDRHLATSGSCARHLAGRVEKDAPFSPRLRRMIIASMDWGVEVAGSGLEAARLLNRLDLDVDDTVDGDEWQQLLVDVIRSPAGREALCSNSWRLLRELALTEGPNRIGLRDVDMEVLRFLDDAEDWEKLETWLLVIWLSSDLLSDVHMEDTKRATLRSLRRPSALERFKSLYEQDGCIKGDQFRQICDQARVK